MLAVIPARGGSKGLPGKNIKLLNGKPLIAYTIEAALESEYIDKVIVTTDSDEIAEVAQKYGASVPFKRPDELSSDTALAIDVYLHAVEFIMNKESKNIDKFMVLLPTAPLRTSAHINKAVEFFRETNAITLISVREAETPITWYMSKNSDERISNAGFGIGNALTNRQVNLKYYVPNGAIYILDYDLLKNNRTYYCDNTVGFEMSAEDSVDIDTMIEFKFAEMLIKERMNITVRRSRQSGVATKILS